MQRETGGTPSRRHVLAAVGFGMIGAAAGASSGTAASLAGTTPAKAAKLPSSLKFGSLADWQAVVGHSFGVAGGGRVKLVSVEAFKTSGRRPAGLPRAQAFAATFEAPAGALDGDRVHRLSHPLLPALAVHLGAATKKNGKSRLVAIFN
jgi:hypothetical protein